MKMACNTYLGEDILKFFLNMCVAELKDIPHGEDKFKASLETLTSTLNSSPGVQQKSMNYNAPHNRAAYMYKLQSCIAWTTYNYIQRAMLECRALSSLVFELLNCADLKLCCIGSGAGSDFIGFLLGISNCFNRVAFKSVTIIPETAEWRGTINRYLETLKAGALNPSFRHVLGNSVSTVIGWNFSKPPMPKVAEKMADANVFLVDKVFPAAASDPCELETTLRNIMSAMKPGALVFFLDHSAGFNVMLRVALNTNQEILFGPLREQYRLPQLPEHFKTAYKCFPQVTSRMYFMAWKNVSSSVTVPLQDSNSFSASSQSLTDVPKPVSSVSSSDSTCSSSVSLPQKSSAHEPKPSVSYKAPSKTDCGRSSDLSASHSELVTREVSLQAGCNNTRIAATFSPSTCKSVRNLNSASNSVSDKSDSSIRELRLNASCPTSLELNGRKATKTILAEATNNSHPTNIGNFADELTYRILVDVRFEMIHHVLSQKGKSVGGECSRDQVVSPLNTDVSDYHGRFSELWPPIQMPSNDKDSECQNDTFFMREHFANLGAFPKDYSQGMFSKTENSFQVTEGERQVEPPHLNKFTQTRASGGSDPRQSNTIQNGLLELTQHVNRLTSIVEELMSSQSKTHCSCCCTASAAPGSMCIGTQSKVPYLVLPLENLSDNPMLFSLLCQSENSKKS